MQVQYPCIRGPCDICGKSFTCQDYLFRYRRVEYEGQKKEENPHGTACNIDLRCIIPQGIDRFPWALLPSRT